MPGKNLFDEARVRALPDGGELVLGPADLATPAALDLAFAKGIRVRYAAEQGAAAPAAPAGPAGGALAKMLARDGTYVVEVRGGRARICLLTDSGPVPLSDG
ncbi:MAG: hypothetical protein AAF682_31710 [Planctomycetota bacterium]